MYRDFKNLLQDSLQTILILVLFFIFSSAGFTFAITNEPDELLPSTQEFDEQKDEKSVPQEEQPPQQLPPYPFMPPIYQTFEMFQKALESMDSKFSFIKKEESKVKVAGYIQAKFRATWYSNEFSIGKARGKVFGNITDYIGYQLMIDPISDKILKDAYVDFNLYPLLKFRAGQFKVPFGLEGVESITTIPIVNRSSVTTNLYRGRDLGVRAAGETDNNKFVYAIAIINGSGENISDRDNYKDIIGRFGINIFNTLDIGVSGHWGRFYKSSIKDFQDKYRVGIDMEHVTDYFKLRGEYIYGENDTNSQESGKANGWYVVCSSTYLYPYEPSIRYEYFKEDINSNSIKQTTLGLNYYFIADTRLMLNYEIRNLLSGDNTFLAQVQIVF